MLGSRGDAGQFCTPRHSINFVVEVIAPKFTEDAIRGRAPGMTTRPRRTIIAAMRRLLMILLMLILPLQWSTAAVAAYCAHEADAGAQQHFGHHTHEHDQDAAPDSPVGGMEKAGFDADCPTCHFLAAPAIFSAAGQPKLQPARRLITPYVGAVPDRDPDTPFRPPLSFLA